MSIQVKIRNVYGVPTIYPVCDKAKVFAAMVGTKTLTQYTVSYIKTLGYTVQVISEFGDTL